MHRLIIEDIPSRDVLIASELTSKEDLLSLQNRELLPQSCAWHNIVYKNLGKVSIQKDKNGAPYVNGADIFISVAHSKGKVAVLFSDRRCGVDIENMKRNFRKVSSMYILPEEEHLLSGDNSLCIIWCTKEAFFKYLDKDGILMLSEICVRNIDYTNHRIMASCRGEEKEFSFEKNGDYLVVCTIN